ncbi:tetratricopeptide repeat protein [Fulvivirgaceae bacterium BMA12]|uniref:histidine kinase n=1 Tax=Agaribacillus aureus TaxID=3051825 RepID=A0ABT8L6N8_9BACT|nr:tetratricopeptide repeat protein [Fulvivirgaceae bacterium BMA12]
MLRLLLLLLIMSIAGTGVNAQSKADSLETALQQTTVDSLKVKILHQLFEAYWYESPANAKKAILEAIDLSEKTGVGYLSVLSINHYADFLNSQADYDSSIVIYEKGLKLAKEIDFNYGIGDALIGLGNNYLSKGNTQKAREYHEMNIAFSEEIDDQAGVASSYNNIGNIYNDLGEYTKAMEHYTLASRKYKALGDEKIYAITLANIGLTHQKLENYPEAIDYFAQSDSSFKKLRFEPGRAFVLRNLGIVYKNMGDFDKSKFYNIKALEVNQRLGNRREIGHIKLVIGNLNWSQDNFKGALPYYHEALDIYIEVGDSLALGTTYHALGKCYGQLSDIAKAEDMLLKALEVATTIGSALTAMDSHKTLAKIYAKKGDFSRAFENMDQYAILRDSLYTKEKRDLANEIEAKYQNEQKEQEIALLESQNGFQALQIRKQKSERNYLIGFAVGILLLMGLVYNQYRIKQKANAKLKELDHLKSDFFANISHEFRTPLSLIMAPLKDKIDKSTDAKETAEYHMMYKNADRLFNLINQLLDLSKLEAGSVQLEKSQVEVTHFFKIIIASFSSMAEYKKIDFKSDIPEEQIWLQFDEDIVQKVCYNLLSNAFKFTPEGGEINLLVNVEAEWLKITISDSGAGIAEEDQEKIFDRFFQSSNGQQLGTGIGLALTKQLVEFHQGKVWLHSATDEGTTFIVEIPVSAAEASETLSVQTHPNQFRQDQLSIEDDVATDDQTKGPVILIVEDDPDLRNYLSTLLFDSYTIHKSNNGVEGIEKAREIIPDLIISDVMMPEKDGMEVCKVLKTSPETDHIPIILLTARADQESKLRGLATGADDYLLKPFDPKELKVRVSNLLSQREKLKSKYSKLLLLQPAEIEISSTQESFLKQAMEIVNKHMDDSSFSAAQFCTEIGLSRMQLHRKLTAMTGHSTSAFVRHQRLIRASQLLAAGEQVSQVAYAVGFENVSYFGKVFKEEYGVVPSEYRHS